MRTYMTFNGSSNMKGFISNKKNEYRGIANCISGNYERNGGDQNEKTLPMNEKPQSNSFHPAGLSLGIF
jgi:hypothetical protein